MSFAGDASARYLKQPTKDAFRERAWAEYGRLGLPDRKNEGWKYSSLNAIAKVSWQNPDAAAAVPAEALRLRDQWRDEFDVLLVLNGELRLSDSVISDPLRALLGETLIPVDHGVFEDGFAGLAAALSRPSIALTVPKFTRVARPVLIVRAQVGESSWGASLNHIHLGQEASLVLAEVFVGESSYLRTETARVDLSPGARVTWLRVQNESLMASHFSDVRARLAATASLSLTQINAGAAWSRNSLIVDIEGSGAEAHLQGLTFGRESQHSDQRVVAQHHAGHTTSSQLFKGVLGGRARGALNGKIWIARDAQKVVSSQLNHNMLTSAQAEANTKPELEIYADDVKANHGASVGRIDAEKLFYLESRGIPRAEAEHLLVQAFAFDVIMKIPDVSLRALADTLSREVAR